MRWTASSYATGYKVQWKSGAQSYDASRQDTTETRYKIPALMWGTTYTVRVLHDLNGNGDATHADYDAAFPNAMSGMGCPSSCTGYELLNDLDFDTDGDNDVDADGTYSN